MASGVRFTGKFETAPLQALLPGHWYIGLACARCGGRFALMNAPGGDGEVEISGDAAFDAVCPNCGEGMKSHAADLVVFQSAQGGAISTT